MYAPIVRKQVRAVFAAISRGDYEPMLQGLSEDFTYTFHGDHALGGVRTQRETMRAWWQRVSRLLPGAQFDVLEVLVNGAPWHTRVAVRLRVLGQLPDGTQYENIMFQYLTLKWAKVTAIESLEDLQVLDRALAIVAAAGIDEAAAAPITDAS